MFWKRDVQKKRSLSIAASCEQMSEHPLGQAIVEKAKEEGVDLTMPEQFSSITGSGIEAVLEGQTISVGNRRLLEKMNLQPDEETENDADPVRERLLCICASTAVCPVLWQSVVVAEYDQRDQQGSG